MSDVSESLQVRTDADERCIERLRALGFNGVVFRGGHGWLTVIPYGGAGRLHLSPERLAAFAAGIAAPVVNYSVNDFAWGFQLALPDGRTTAFMRWLVALSQLGLTADQARVPHLDETILAVVVPPARVRQFLGPAELQVNGEFEWELFARAIGFPQYIQLNPAYVTENPAGIPRLGGIEIGHRP